MKQSFIITLFSLIILISTIIPVYSLPWPPDMDVIYIKFNYTSGYSYDALTIKKNNSTQVQVPEWYPSYSRNEPFAYIKSQSNRKIEAKFWVEAGGRETIKIKAIMSGQGIGNINTTSVFFDDAQYATKVMTSSGSVPGSVGIRSFSWSWYATQIDDYVFEDPLWICDTGDHEYYTLLGAPQSPMSVPWTEVLDYSCDWANYLSSSSGATIKVVQNIYDNLGLVYDTNYGAPSYTTNGGSGSFNLTTFLSDIPGSNLIVNCYDCGKAVKIFTNSLGSGTDYQYSTPFGYVNCIKPVGCGWTNNPFYSSQSYPYNQPIVGEDDAGRTSFGNHAFAALSSNIYDACLKVDTDGNPDDGPPFTESWIFGWSWSWYKSKVVDNDPATSTGDPSTPNFSVY